MVVNEIVSGGLSIASACIQYKIDEVYMVRERVARIYSNLLVVKIKKIGLDTWECPTKKAPTLFRKYHNIENSKT